MTELLTPTKYRWRTYDDMGPLDQLIGEEYARLPKLASRHQRARRSIFMSRARLAWDVIRGKHDCWYF